MAFLFMFFFLLTFVTLSGRVGGWWRVKGVANPDLLLTVLNILTQMAHQPSYFFLILAQFQPDLLIKLLIKKASIGIRTSSKCILGIISFHALLIINSAF